MVCISFITFLPEVIQVFDHDSLFIPDARSYHLACYTGDKWFNSLFLITNIFCSVISALNQNCSINRKVYLNSN